MNIAQITYPKEVTNFLSELMKLGFNIQIVQKHNYVEYFCSAVLSICNGCYPVVVCLQYANPNKIYATLAIDYSDGRGMQCVLQTTRCEELSVIVDAVTRNMARV